jgi:hypothetical protein
MVQGFDKGRGPVGLSPIGQACHLPAEPHQGPREGSLVRSRSAPQPARCAGKSGAAKPPPSVLLAPRSGLVTVTRASLCRAGAEQSLAVVVAEQENEPVQVGRAVARCHSWGGRRTRVSDAPSRSGWRASPQELQKLGEFQSWAKTTYPVRVTKELY